VPTFQFYQKILELVDRGVIAVVYGADFGKYWHYYHRYYNIIIPFIRHYLKKFTSPLILRTLDVPGQDFCTWSGEDVSKIRFPIAEVNSIEFAAIQEELQNGAQIQIRMTSEGKTSINLISELLNYLKTF